MTRAVAMFAAIVLIAIGVCLFVFAAGRQNRRSDADSERAALPNALPRKPSVDPEFARAVMRHPVNRRIDLDAEFAAVSPCNDPTCTTCRPPAA